MQKTSNWFPRNIFFLLLLIAGAVHAQPVTGIWNGKIRSTKLELKLIKKGDSLVGTSYYYESADHFRRYAVRGYFDEATNNVVWWDEVLLEDQSGRNSIGHEAMLAVADFNCPGEDVMKLEGHISTRDNSQAAKIPLNLQKIQATLFPDEWDYVLTNYTRGANDPELIDSVSLVALAPAPIPSGYEEAPIARVQTRAAIPEGMTTISVPEPVTAKSGLNTIPEPQLTVEQKFTSRTKTLQTVIPVTGDSIELRFYDNAEIDGDSIAIFLNGRLLEQHVLLSDQPHTMKIPVKELSEDNELVMVAENLGSIPPNTSLMVAIVGENRYEARLQSTEGSSALVRFVKEVPGK